MCFIVDYDSRCKPWWHKARQAVGLVSRVTAFAGLVFSDDSTNALVLRIFYSENGPIDQGL
jgi:hypothetical protein